MADYTSAPRTMAARIASWIVFVVLMTFVIAGSLVVVVCLYLPYVALKAVYMGIRGKVSLKAGTGTRDPHGAAI